MRKSEKLVLTGGHAATTAVAVIEAIRKDSRLNDFEIIWIGSSVAREGSNDRTLESQIMPKMGIKTFSINAGKIQTKFTAHTLTWLLKIPIGFIESFFLLIKIRPKVVLSFGGYASFPVVFWAWAFRIPVIIHEQTVAAGRATLASALFATKITLAREESLKYFPVRKTEIIGNPIRESVLKVIPKTKIGNPLTLLVMGGSRGSDFINELMGQFSQDFLSKFNVIHLGGGNKNVNPGKMAEIYNEADIIISRSGANSVSEILYVKRPAILIPLPRTFMNEQGKNADYAKEFGIAKVLTESEATPKRVEIVIGEIKNNWSEIIGRVKNKKSPDINASTKLASILANYI